VTKLAETLKAHSVDKVKTAHLEWQTCFSMIHQKVAEKFAGAAPALFSLPLPQWGIMNSLNKPRRMTNE